MISRFGGKLMYNPRAVIEHLRIPSGGTRKESASKGMLYLLGIVAKDLFFRKHGLTSIIWMIFGLIKGFKTRKI